MVKQITLACVFRDVKYAGFISQVSQRSVKFNFTIPLGLSGQCMHSNCIDQWVQHMKQHQFQFSIKVHGPTCSYLLSVYRFPKTIPKATTNIASWRRSHEDTFMHRLGPGVVNSREDIHVCTGLVLRWLILMMTFIYALAYCPLIILCSGVI